MTLNLPGTVLDFETRDNGDYFGIIAPVFSAFNGITLSQVKELTNLTTATIQNWVKRGYIPSPIDKRYEKRHLLRIILINSIKGGMKIEDVQRIMVYINGDVEDTSDDIISDEELYNCLCRVIKICQATSFTDETAIKNAVSVVLESYTGPTQDSKQRLENALYIMVCAFTSARLRDMSTERLQTFMP
jgi:DNA-binding transcriptional MerR regulator